GEFGVYFEDRQDRFCALRDGGRKPVEKGHECDRREARRQDLLSHVTAPSENRVRCADDTTGGFYVDGIPFSVRYDGYVDFQFSNHRYRGVAYLLEKTQDIGAFLTTLNV